jgi:excisionase family DNA binding protein
MTNPSPSRSLLTERTAAEYLSLSHRTLQAWRVRGGGPQYIKLGVNVRYRPADLDAWLSERVRTNTAAS